MGPSCFARPESIAEIPRASGPIFLSRTCFQRYRGRRVPFSCFARPDSMSAVPRASDPVVMFCVPGLVFSGTVGVSPIFTFCAPGLVFGGIRGVGSRFLVLRPHTRFRRYRGHQIPFSRFALPGSFWTVLGASGPVFLFCACRLVFGGTVGVGSHFHVMRSRSLFRRYRGCRVPFSFSVRPDSFPAVPRA
jgi:hypothetical protein